MKKIFLALFPVIYSSSYACTTCNKELQQQIYDSTFVPNLAVMLSAFFVLALIVIVLSRITLKRHTNYITKNPGTHLNPVPLSTASIVLGIGLGGFLDGILLHQILQWHEMLSNKVSVDTVMGKSVNMFWDGVFHFFCLIVSFVGVVLLYKLLFRSDVNRSKGLFYGGMLLGWGIFNIVEGVIDHQILKLHFVRQQSPDPEFWNLAFLGASVVMILIGCLLVYRRNHYQGSTNP